MDNIYSPLNIFDTNRLVIIGNGFDLDLGYPTSYKDFVNNINSSDKGAFPFKKGTNYHDLGRFLLKCINTNKWYDLENILAQYGKPVSERELSLEFNGIQINIGSFYKYLLSVLSRKYLNNKNRVDSDKIDYLSLVTSLADYLRSIDLSIAKQDSVAARFIKALSRQDRSPQFYTFNYTNLCDIGVALGVSIASPIYIHGNLKDDNIILGVGDYAELRPSYNYLYKTSNSSYSSTNLFDALDTSNEIYIFGLSMSPVDYPYFEDFFRNIASGKYSCKKKYIRIFTYDDFSRTEIMLNLRKMNKGVIKLQGYSDIDIIRTKDNIDEVKVRNVLYKISH